MSQGKLIVIYGINNLGKTTQTKKLVERIIKEGYKAEYIKYPHYNTEPAGKLINDYFRSGNPYNFSPRELQLLYCLDRAFFEKILKDKLDRGINIVAEDYRGTGIAWGTVNGVDEKLLKYLNNFFYPENISFLLDGERYINSIEEDHKHEKDEELTKKARLFHFNLAKEYGWTVINANRSIEEIHEEIWEKIISSL